MSDLPHVSIHYADHETGWAEDLGNGTYRISNIPLEPGLNIDDIVTLKSGDPKCCTRPVVDKILSRELRHKLVITYKPGSKKNYTALCAAVERAGGKCEGLVSGTAGVAVRDLDRLVQELEALPFKTAVIPGDTEDPHEH